MPDLNHKFQTGRMNKDLDERLVPNGEYRDALNAQVSTTDGSDIGSLQNIMGNLDISYDFFVDPSGAQIPRATLETFGFYCVGSILDEKTDRLYWLVSGGGVDFIAEYDYNTKRVSPIAVDTFPPSLPPGAEGRVLNFDKSYLITGINIVDEILFWTDNNTEPKRINIPQIRIGTSTFLNHTEFYVPNPYKPDAVSIPYVSVGLLKEEHITVIKKAPQVAPTLEMKNTSRDDIPGSGSMAGEISTTLGGAGTPFDLTPWFDSVNQQPITDTDFVVTFDTDPDFKIGDILVIESIDLSSSTLKKTKILVEIVAGASYPTPIYFGGQLTCEVQILSWDSAIDLTDTNFNVYLSQEKALFEFRFPRFATRYKYKDGEYSAFSPFSEVAFLPGEYDYVPKEGYNLAMVNRVRELGVCKFIDHYSLPEDVVSIDILYKESDSPAVYSIKTIDRVTPFWVNPEYDAWNAATATTIRSAWESMYGYVDIEAEMIHSLLPSNQLLRNYDNVPKQALAQEVIGNRLVYGNYLQNYNMSSSKRYTSEALRDASGLKTFLPSKNITSDLKISYKSLPMDTVNLIPEQLDAGKAYSYKSAKTIKSLRTYQLGVIYIDEYGRETPVFSSSKTNANTVYVPKTSAPQQTKLKAQILNAKPDFAKSFKFLVKETTSEYYNLAMDRWYPAEDGNIWLSFPSSDRNKVDLETFLILKKAHESNTPVTNKARYKILDIENEAPSFIKTKRTPVRTITDGFVQDASGANVASIFMAGSPTAPGYTNSSYPFTAGRFIDIHKDFAEAVQTAYDESLSADIASGGTRFQFRIISVEGASKWYDLKHVEISPVNDDYIRFRPAKEFGVDMSITTPFDTTISPSENAYSTNKIEFITRQEKNLPEFEGRFFAKILKDATLQESILGYEPTSTLYSVNKSIKSQYINTNVTSGGPYDPSVSTASWYGLIPSGDTNLISVDSDRTTYIPSGFGDGVGPEYWELAGNTENSDSQSSGWFIDKIEGFRTYQYNAHYYNAPSSAYNFLENTLAGISIFTKNLYGTASYNSSGVIHTHNDPYRNPATCQTTYGSMDCNWNYDWGTTERPQQMMQLIGDGTNHISNGQGGILSGYLGHANIAPPIESVTPNNYPGASVIRRASTADNGGILPGVGISESNMSSGNTALITLSYAGTNSLNKSRTNFGNLNDVKSHFSSADNALDYVEHELFVNLITTPGTIWRWKEDPGQVVYRTLPLNTANTSYGSSNSIWAANEFDTIDNLQGVSLYNYATFADYAASHTVRNIGDSSLGQFYSSTLTIQNMASYGIRNHGRTVFTNNPATAALVVGYFTGQTASKLNIAEREKDHFNRLALPPNTPYYYGGRNLTSTGNRWPTFTGRWNSASNKRRRFTIHCGVQPAKNAVAGIDLDGSEGLGGVTPHFYLPTNDPTNAPHFDHTGTAFTGTSIPSTKAPGIRPDGMYSGYDMTGGASSSAVYYSLNSNDFTKIPKLKMQDGSGNVSPAPGSVTWQILETYAADGIDEGYFTPNPAIWETEPKDNLGLEIYHEVGQIYPTELNAKTAWSFFGPLHASVRKNSSVTCSNASGNVVLNTAATGTPDDTDIRISSVGVSGDKVYVYLVDVNYNLLNGAPGSGQSIPSPRDFLTFRRPDGSATTVQMRRMPNAGTVHQYEVYTDVHNYEVTLPFFNAYSFGNGVESNRIRDDFNQIFIDKGPKVSAVLEEPYKEERRSSGFIYSGIYNSMSGVNNLNQFIQAEKITKDLNPSYGSIQKLFARNTDLVTFCEDKVFKILANKDALFNADGNPQLTATENVLGQTIPFAGDYGISTDPESFAYDNYRLYFSDRTRGTILRLSQDGITPISQYGMSKWFADNLPDSTRVIGSFDDKKKEYNVHLNYFNYDSIPVGILGTPQVTFQTPGAPPPPVTYLPLNVLTATYKEANKINVGDTVYGPGILVGTVVTSKTSMGGGLWEINISQTPDISILGNPVAYGMQTVGVIGDVIWQTKIYSSKDDKDPYTLSYSERSKGWPSFKSFNLENGLSLNNEYFTFKNGLLYQHHANETYNNFYGEQYDSSVEVIFNEEPSSVKSFQTVDYEGTQSKVSADIDNSGEYWDNYEKTGWYIDNMYTNLQEVKPAEFKNKEGKWFSTIKGVHTEWLNDGTAGNIDTREFSYQGIDNNHAVSIVNGNNTSWECQQRITQGAYCPYGFATGGHPATEDNSGGNCSNRQNIPIYPTISGNPGSLEIAKWFFDNPSENVDDWKYPIVGNVLSSNAPANPCFTPSTDPMYNPNFTYNLGRILKGFSLLDYTTTPPNVLGVYKTVSDLVGELIKLCPDTGYFKGMTYAEYMAINQDSPPGSTVTATHICVERQDALGAYVDEAQCNNDVNSQCNTNCSVPNLVTVHPINGVTPTAANTTCTGSVSVEVYLSGTATSWTVYYEDTNGTIVLVDPTTYFVGGYSATQQLDEGDYIAYVVDDLGCKQSIEFSIECVPPPCPQSPGTFSLTGTKPTFNVSLGRCWEIGDSGPISNSGSFSIVNLGLTAPATSWGYELYLEGPPIIGIPTYTLISSQSGFAATTGIVVNGLEEGTYRLRYTDNTGCPYLGIPLQLACIDICDEDISIAAVNGEYISDSGGNPCILNGIDNNTGGHEILQIDLPSTWTSSNSYTVQYYSYPSGTVFTQATATSIGSLQGPYTDFVNINGSIGSVTNLPSSDTSGNDYAIVWTDNLGCESLHTFKINCVDIPPCSKATNPVSTFTVTPATSIECASHDNNDGVIAVNTVTTQLTASSFNLEFKLTAASGNTTILQGYYNEPSPSSSSFNVQNLTSWLPAGSYYSYTITDNLGCTQTKYPIVNCIFDNPAANNCGATGTYIPDLAFEIFLETHQGVAAGVNNTNYYFYHPLIVPAVPTNLGVPNTNSGINPTVTVGSASSMGNQFAGDHCVTTNRINWVTHLDMGAPPTPSGQSGISYVGQLRDITGIEDFFFLTHLNVYKNLLSSIDVSQNTNLITLNARNQYGSSGIYNVYGQFPWLAAHPNVAPLTNVNVTGLTNLQYLDLAENGLLSSLDISTNTALKYLRISYTTISSVDYSNNTELTILSCAATQQTELDLSNCDNLEQLSAVREDTGFQGTTAYWHTFNSGFSVPHFTDVYISPNCDLTNLWADLHDHGLNGMAHIGTTVHVGSGVVPGTTGGTGAGGQQTRVEYCQSVRAASQINPNLTGQGQWSVHASVTFVA